MLIKTGSALFVYLRETAARQTQELIDAGLYDPDREGPQVDQIVERLKPAIESGQQVSSTDGPLGQILHMSLKAGAAFQGLGNMDIAALWYPIGQYVWVRKGHWYDGNLFDLDWNRREGPAFLQEEAAVSAALAGNAARAEQNFRWAAENRTKTEQEIQDELKDRNYQSIWQSLGFQLFDMMWLGEDWEEIHRLAELGKQTIEKTRKAGYPRDFREPQILIEIAWHLSRYFLDPGRESREGAVSVLRLNQHPDRDTRTRVNLLPYLFTLAQRYPELSPFSETEFQQRLWRPADSRREKPPSADLFQFALDEIFWQAERKKKAGVTVSSFDLHVQVGGYPDTHHQMKCCHEVMRKNMTAWGDRITGQTPGGDWLEITYSIPRQI